MSGIEKICEFSDDSEYLGGDMYEHKRNLIQINPEHRHKFQNKNCTLVLVKVEYVLESKDSYCPCFEFAISQGLRDGQKLGKRYTYELRTDDLELQGRVEGVYLNWSLNWGATKRKIRKLVSGQKYLTITSEKDFKDKRNIENFEQANELFYL